MKGKVAIITGASSGFGLLTTVELCKKGLSVVATMRNLENKETIIKLCKQQGVPFPTHFFQLDITDAASRENFAKQLKELPSVDILINNAGFALGGFAEETSIHEYKEQFETNFFGTIAVTQLVLPYMRKQRKGKIINISSISGQIAFPGLSPYVASKHALNGWAESLRLEVNPFGIDVVLIEPGSFQTNIWTKGKRIAARSELSTSPYSNYKHALEKELAKGAKNYGNPEKVAQLISKLCMKERLHKLRYPIGRGVKTMYLLKKITPWILWETVILKKLKQL